MVVIAMGFLSQGLVKGNSEVLEEMEYLSLLWGHPPCQKWRPPSVLHCSLCPGVHAVAGSRWARGWPSRSPAQCTVALPATCVCWGGGGRRSWGLWVCPSLTSQRPGISWGAEHSGGMRTLLGGLDRKSTRLNSSH